MKIKYIVVAIVDVFFLMALLLSYYLKRQIGYVIYNWATLCFMFVFVVCSLILALQCKKVLCIIIQIICFAFLFIMIKCDFSDRFALLIEVPKIEKGLNNNEKVNDGYILFDWEPGFLDYQWVLVYDEKDSLQYAAEKKIKIPEGKLYILYRAKKCFYLCILRR